MIIWANGRQVKEVEHIGFLILESAAFSIWRRGLPFLVLFVLVQTFTQAYALF